MLNAWKMAASHHSLALDALSARVMLADPEFRILYLNRSLTDFLKQAEPQLRQTWPDFCVEALVGRKIDAFHQNPDHQRQMISHMRGRREASIEIGGRKFDLSVTPLRAGDRVSGYSVEWADAEHRLQNIDFSVAAFLRHQAVIVFAPDGAIIEANANFLRVMGYEAKEIVGRHHSLFVESAVASGPDYRAFWEKLRAGQYQAGEFRRVGKGGREVWIQGSYNPIVDENGKVLKVVSFALEVAPRGDAAPAGLAEGDLTQRPRDPLTPELDRLCEDINCSVDTLRHVEESARAIQTGTAEIESASNDFSSGAEQQVASLNESTAALNQVTETIRLTAESGGSARRVVAQAAEVALRSNEIVNRTTAATAAINQSSKQVSQIIGAIDEIAFQTNLLALNAGVEAARAGDAGRGLAVVASEVRALAQRSAEAAKEIKTLVKTFGAQGVELVDGSSGALRRVVERVNQINDVIGEMAASASAQATTAAEVNIAIGDMDPISQRSAAVGEGFTAATGALAMKTRDLLDAVNRFKLDAERAPAPPSARAA
jgi:methyl-accepting chemotaxis protein